MTHLLGHTVQRRPAYTEGRLWPLLGSAPTVLANAKFAYSTRKVVAAYAGQCCRLRRSSDNAESDFGFDASGDLDVAAIATFVGGGSGFLRTWYDQSGGGFDATQTTTANQPLYVASIQNSRPGFRLDGSNDKMSSLTSTFDATQLTILIAHKLASDAASGSTLLNLVRNSGSEYNWYFQLGRSSDTQWWYQAAEEGSLTSVVETSIDNALRGVACIYSARLIAGQTDFVYRNSTQVANFADGLFWESTTGTVSQIGQGVGDVAIFKGDLFEIIGWNTFLPISSLLAVELYTKAYWSTA